MPPNPFSSDHTIFRDRDALEFDHVPEQFNYRDAQMKDLAYALSPGIHGSRLLNAVLRGLPGTGKTTSVKRIFAEAEETTRRMIPVYVNCQSERTLYAILSQIHSRLFGHSPPVLGNPGRQLLHKIGKAMMDRKVVLAVCLDDANYLMPERLLNNVLYVLLRTYETYPGTKIGVIATVSNIDTDFTRELDSCVMSVFQPMEIYFSPYTRGEIHDILQGRVRQALFPGAVPEKALDLIVDRTVSCGDLRVGLDLIRRAATSADREGLMEIGSRHIESAFEFSQHVHLETTMKTLTAEDVRLLAHIARLAIDDPDAPITTGMLYESTQMQMRMSYTAFHQRIKKFDQLRLICVNPMMKGRGGKTREIALRYDPEQMMRACGGGGGSYAAPMYSDEQSISMVCEERDGAGDAT